MDKVFFIMVDHGDGSAGVLFFRHEENAQAVLDQELEEHFMNEGGVRSLNLINPTFEDD